MTRPIPLPADDDSPERGPFQGGDPNSLRGFTPQITLAAFCEKFVIDTDGRISLIQVVDTVIVPSAVPSKDVPGYFESTAQVRLSAVVSVIIPIGDLPPPRTTDTPPLYPGLLSLEPWTETGTISGGSSSGGLHHVQQLEFEHDLVQITAVQEFRWGITTEGTIWHAIWLRRGAESKLEVIGAIPLAVRFSDEPSVYFRSLL